MNTMIHGRLEIDHDRGVIYFHADHDEVNKRLIVTALRICSLLGELTMESAATTIANFTIAKYVGEPDDPAIEAACAEFRNQQAKMEQDQMQRRQPPLKQVRKAQWDAAKAIVKAWQENQP